MNENEWTAIDKTFERILYRITVNNSTGLEEVMDRYRKVFKHNVPKGKRSRVLLAVKTTRLIAEKNKRLLTDEEIEEARILGWTAEMLVATILIIDDIMDQSINRRGNVCWYKNV